MKTVFSRRWLIVALLVAPSISNAYEFVPTDSEFYAWPAFCRAKYVLTPIGQTTQFAHAVSQDQVESGRAEVGDAVFLHVHHYCSGAALVGRGKSERDPAKKKFLFTTAIGDLNYVTARIPADAPVMANALFSLAEAYEGLNDHASAVATLEKAVRDSPQNPGSYIALGLFLRNNKDLEGSRKALQQGVNATNGGSAELNYDLAFVLLELKDNDNALKYARKAYELGYPLPGLRNKLMRMGLWEATSTANRK